MTFIFSSGSGFVDPTAESFFGAALAMNGGSVWIAAPEADVAWRFDDPAATASVPDAESPLVHGTSLTAFGEGVVGGKARTSFQKICSWGKFFEMIKTKNSEIPEGADPPTTTFQKKAFGVDDRRRDATMVDHVRTSARRDVRP